MASSFIHQAIGALTWAAALGTGLMGGVFFSFSAFVMKALGRLPARERIAAMQSINIAAINPIFMGVFFGTAAVCVLLAIYSLKMLHDRGAFFLLAGLLYLVGGIVVTAAFNVPLNNSLARVDSTTVMSVWTGYLSAWCSTTTYAP